MKNYQRGILAVSVLLIAISANIKAQESEVVEEEVSSPFTVGADLVSSYVWRGVKFGGPALQPMVEFSKSGFTLGAWGSFGIGPVDEAVNEADLYVSYGFDFGLSIGLSDYYYQGAPYFEYGDSISSHALEINVGYEIKNLSISANYILNNSTYGAGSVGGDMYFELAYAFKNFNFFIGAGDGWHTSTNNFEVCNIGISASKELKISDKFSLPVSGLVSINPQLETLNIVGTITF
ncbi:MAG: hypothetical protein P1P88_03675 [Bacteroidales bacterium]|nr:hypothetical protein [Bacteroidales bacterium]